MKLSIFSHLIIIGFLVGQVAFASETSRHATACEINSKKGSLIFKEKFDNNLDAWVAEYVAKPGSSIRIENKKLVMDVAGGATVWLKQPLSGNYTISYRRQVIVQQGKNDRLSDMNQFWMASDPHNSNLFSRTGVFEEYDKLQLYYAGIGGNTNTTTRFRKYSGTGERILITDLQDQSHLLKANHDYKIEISVYKGCTQLSVDGQVYFSYLDTEPLTKGYFGFRTTQSRQEIDDLVIYSLDF